MPDFIMSYLGIKDAITPGAAGSQFWALVYVFIIFAGVSVAVVGGKWLERQARAPLPIFPRPPRGGPRGVLPPPARARKLMLLEENIPPPTDHNFFFVVPL